MDQETHLFLVSNRDYKLENRIHFRFAESGSDEQKPPVSTEAADGSSSPSAPPAMQRFGTADKIGVAALDDIGDDDHKQGSLRSMSCCC